MAEMDDSLKSASVPSFHFLFGDRAYPMSRVSAGVVVHKIGPKPTYKILGRKAKGLASIHHHPNAQMESPYKFWAGLTLPRCNKEKLRPT